MHLKKYLPQLADYLEKISIHWQIETKDTLDTYIQILVYSVV